MHTVMTLMDTEMMMTTTTIMILMMMRIITTTVFSENIPEFYREDLLREIYLMKGLGYHPNIVTMLGACTIREPIALIVEYMPFGNLQTFLK